MSRVIKSLMILVLSFSFFGCSQRPAFTIEVLETATPVAPLSESPLTATLPAEIPTIAVMPADFSPILYGKRYDADTFFLLLGGLQGDVWLAPDLAFVRFLNIPPSRYEIYTFAKGQFHIEGYAPQFSPTSKSYSMRAEETLNEIGMIGVAQGWPVLQRAVQELAADNELYRQAVLDWLAAEGVAEPQLDTLHIFRVDIEGDGVDEIFISATHLDGSQHITRAGDYSIVLLRKVAGNEAVTLLIVGDIYRSTSDEITYLCTYSLANFIDLNQDGTLEVLVDVERWERAGAILYQIEGQDVIETLRVE